MTNTYNIIDNYIYLFHTEEFLLLPQYPDSVHDKLITTFAQQNALSRTAPIFAYSHSGPRNVQVSLELHRDMVSAENVRKSNMNVVTEDGDDYVDTLIKRLQSIALPKFDASTSAIVPPMVAIRFGNEIFVKGVVTDGISIEYQKPILENNKYAKVTISFTVSEVTPYDATSIAKVGSFRGITRQFKNGIYKGEE